MSTRLNEPGGEVRPTDLAPLPFVVRKVHKELPGIFTLEMEPSTGQFNFRPGQFNMLYIFGNGEVPISISGDPQQPACLVHTVRAVGKVSAAICDLSRGETLGVRGPFGTNWPVHEIAGGDVVFITSGLGLAPLRPAIYHVLNHREQYGKVTLLYGARTPDRLLYHRQLADWKARWDLRVEISVGSAGPDWGGHIGVATSLIAGLEIDPEQTNALICSSERMMKAMAEELNLAGLPDERIHLSLERDMKCGVGLCGHCQLGPQFICLDGPVYSLDRVRPLISLREL